jgi:hypothetical protein
MVTVKTSVPTYVVPNVPVMVGVTELVCWKFTVGANVHLELVKVPGGPPHMMAPCRCWVGEEAVKPIRMLIVFTGVL